MTSAAPPGASLQTESNSAASCRASGEGEIGREGAGEQAIGAATKAAKKPIVRRGEATRGASIDFADFAEKTIGRHELGKTGALPSVFAEQDNGGKPHHPVAIFENVDRRIVFMRRVH